MKRTGRLRAVSAGAVVPLLVGVATVITLAVFSEADRYWAKSFGPLGLILLTLPGTTILGLIFAVPISVAHVCTMAWLSRRFELMDSLIVWTLAGLIFSAPLSSLLHFTLDGAGGPDYGLLFGLSLGAIGGAAAGWSRPRIVS